MSKKPSLVTAARDAVARGESPPTEGDTPMRNFTLSIPAALHTRLKSYAAESGTTMGGVVCEATTKYLDAAARRKQQRETPG
ncbi:MAG: hypothetical protein F4Z16_06805 [Rhodothermaceae bacterium]|nr:hypothetical protein [Rhodothermaceae bacterium]MYD66804.1 hypothetical protein [Rhodothermaceae bacterium]MYJ08386.1 hypothetical protein [Rhodothermaceae bacterium]